MVQLGLPHEHDHNGVRSHNRQLNFVSHYDKLFDMRCFCQLHRRSRPVSGLRSYLAHLAFSIRIILTMAGVTWLIPACRGKRACATSRTSTGNASPLLAIRFKPLMTCRRFWVSSLLSSLLGTTLEDCARVEMVAEACRRVAHRRLLRTVS